MGNCASTGTSLVALHPYAGGEDHHRGLADPDRRRGAQGPQQLPGVRLDRLDPGGGEDLAEVDQLEIEPRSAGPYVFGSAQEARSFVESSLVALQVLGCKVA